MNKKVIRINENTLKKIVTESVKVALNEISPKLGLHASEKAFAKGRAKQGANLAKMSINKLKAELGITGDSCVRDINDGSILYITKDNIQISILSDGRIAYSNDGEQFRQLSSADFYQYPSLKVAKPKDARIIAKWVSMFCNSEEISRDWHDYASL